MTRIRSVWDGASVWRRALLVGLPALALLGAAIGLAFAFGGDSDGGTEEQAQAAATATPLPATPTDSQIEAFYAALAVATATPAAAATGGGGGGGGGGGTGGGGGGTYVPRPSGGTGPGPITGTGMSMQIPSLGVNAGVYGRTVGTNGVMGNPAGAWDVIWYDFSTWGTLGGYPGAPGANAVFAGHVDYIRVGPAVFYSVKNLKAGDQVTVNTPNGPVTYAIQWSRWVSPGQDFTWVVAQDGTESITLVTCIGGFSAGHYSNRLVVRGVRI